MLLKVGDNISTDEISPAGVRALPFRSNIPKLAMFSFTQIDDSYPERTQEAEDSGHIIVAGDNYGQGSSREHAAIAPRYLGLRVVIAKSFARIHWQNLANYEILALESRIQIIQAFGSCARSTFRQVTSQLTYRWSQQPK